MDKSSSGLKGGGGVDRIPDHPKNPNKLLFY